MSKVPYHVAFSYDSPMVGLLTVPASSEEEATALIKKLTAKMNNVTIIDLTTSADVPNFQQRVEEINAAVEDELREYSDDDDVPPKIN